MQTFYALLVVLVCATPVQAEWTWVAWHRTTHTTGPYVGQDGAWETVALFQHEFACKDYMSAMIDLEMKRFKSTDYTPTDVSLYVDPTPGKDFGRIVAVKVVDIKAQRSWVTEWDCLPYQPVMLRPAGQRRWEQPPSDVGTQKRNKRQ